MAARTTIAIVYHKIPKDGSYISPDHQKIDADTFETVQFFERLFTRQGYRVKRIGVSPNNLVRLAHVKAHYIFNLVDSKQMEIKIAKILDRLRTPHSGSSRKALTTSNNKIRMKKLFDKHEIPTPPYTIVFPRTRISKRMIPADYPLIVKPVFEHGSVGVSKQSIVRTYSELVRTIKMLRQQFRQSLLIEQLIVGREFHVTVLETNAQTIALPLAEISFSRKSTNTWNIYGFEEKWDETQAFRNRARIRSPAKKLSKRIEFGIRNDAIRAFYVLRFRDYARFDVRFSPSTKQWYFLEGNANAGIVPPNAPDPMNASIHAANMTLTDFIGRIIANRFPNLQLQIRH